MWPTPMSDAASAKHSDPTQFPELAAEDLLGGALVTFRVLQSTVDNGMVHLTAGHVIKVPLCLSTERGLRLKVFVPPASYFEIYFVTSQPPSEQASEEAQLTSGRVINDKPAEERDGDMAEGICKHEEAGAGNVPAAAPATSQQQPLPWHIENISGVLTALNAAVADELCIERYSSRISLKHSGVLRCI
jgi:hypothetical protein